MAVTLLKSYWSGGNLIFEQTSDTGDAAIHFGRDNVGVDVKFFGATASKYALWDQSADKFIFVGAAPTCDTAATSATDIPNKTYVDTAITTATGTSVSTANAYTDAAVALLIDSAPGALDTLNELAAALNDDASAFTTITNAYTSADTTLSGNLVSEYTAADAVVTSAFGAADTALEATISGAYTAADVVVTSAFGAADTVVLSSAQSYADALFSAGATGWFDDGTNFRVTVSGGLITDIGTTVSGGYSSS